MNAMQFQTFVRVSIPRDKVSHERISLMESIQTCIASLENQWLRENVSVCSSVDTSSLIKSSSREQNEECFIFLDVRDIDMALQALKELRTALDINLGNRIGSTLSEIGADLVVSLVVE